MQRAHTEQATQTSSSVHRASIETVWLWCVMCVCVGHVEDIFANCLSECREPPQFTMTLNVYMPWAHISKHRRHAFVCCVSTRFSVAACISYLRHHILYIIFHSINLFNKNRIKYIGKLGWGTLWFQCAKHNRNQQQQTAAWNWEERRRPTETKKNRRNKQKNKKKQQRREARSVCE